MCNMHHCMQCMHACNGARVAYAHTHLDAHMLAVHPWVTRYAPVGPPTAHALLVVHARTHRCSVHIQTALAVCSIARCMHCHAARSVRLLSMCTAGDCVPGRMNTVILHLANTGVLHGQCSEICGALHGFMPLAIACIWSGCYRDSGSSCDSTLPATYSCNSTLACIVSPVLHTRAQCSCADAHCMCVTHPYIVPPTAGCSCGEHGGQVHAVYPEGCPYWGHTRVCKRVYAPIL